jgi:hypothetical protein
MDKSTFYHFRVKGHLDETLAGWFEDMTVSNLEEGDALLAGFLPDQAALQGILKRISDLGLTLISVNAVTEGD